ncbi:MAG: hypothetical protein IKL90_04575 [Alphaproteobacteria bacterium]|nr:hypothetical protein [Alphaproteobacteria bacterium]
MSEKQRFNKGVQSRQMAEKRRERWMSRKILTEILEVVRKQRDDSNWIIYQVLKNDNDKLSYKSKVKMFNHLMREGYAVDELRPIKDLIIPGDMFFLD